jgi:hypothetical protein
MSSVTVCNVPVLCVLKCVDFELAYSEKISAEIVLVTAFRLIGKHYQSFLQTFR